MSAVVAAQPEPSVAPLSERAALLTAREIHILGLLALGLNRRAVAERLALSELTIKTHLARVFERLHAPNQGAAIAAAVAMGALRLRPTPRRRVSPQCVRVLELMADGRTNEQIARSLTVSIDTVRTHARLLFKALGVRSRAHAVAVGIGSGLLERRETPDGVRWRAA